MPNEEGEGWLESSGSKAMARQTGNQSGLGHGSKPGLPASVLSPTAHEDKQRSSPTIYPQSLGLLKQTPAPTCPCPANALPEADQLCEHPRSASWLPPCSTAESQAQQRRKLQCTTFEARLPLAVGLVFRRRALSELERGRPMVERVWNQR